MSERTFKGARARVYLTLDVPVDRFQYMPYIWTNLRGLIRVLKLGIVSAQLSMADGRTISLPLKGDDNAID